MNVTVNDERRTRRTTYLVFAAIFLLLTGAALLIFGSRKADAEAQQKAAQLATELGDAGLRVPSTEQIVYVLGNDGGATCAYPNDALRRGALFGQLTNGAAGPGIRPVIADNKVVQGQLLIIKVYCPGELEDFTETVHKLKFADVAAE
jgi:hypothetical protein